jgi:hypothetical protein
MCIGKLWVNLSKSACMPQIYMKVGRNDNGIFDDFLECCLQAYA